MSICPTNNLSNERISMNKKRSKTMAKTINFSAMLLVLLLVFIGIMEKGEAQVAGCEWECKRLPNFRCWMGQMGKNLCADLCKNEGASQGLCVSDAATDSHRCLCRKAGCS